MRNLLTITTILLMGLSSFSANTFAANADVQKTYESVVRVQCIVTYQGQAFDGGHGSGSLLNNAKNVMTNAHVVHDCDPENKKNVYADLLKKRYKAKVFKIIKNPKSLARDKLDIKAIEILDTFVKLKKTPKYANVNPEELLDHIIGIVADNDAPSGLPHVTQELTIGFIGKNTNDVQKIGATIMYSSWRKANYSKYKNFDFSVLDLDRPLHDRPSINAITTKGYQVTDEVYAIGFPGIAELKELTSNNSIYVPSLTKGTISKIDEGDLTLSPKDRAEGVIGIGKIQTNAEINPGNSGGPLVDVNGNVIGMLTWSKGSGVGWAQMMHRMLPIMKDLGIAMPTIIDQQSVQVEPEPNPELEPKPEPEPEPNQQLYIWIGVGVLALLGLIASFLFLRPKNKTADPSPAPAPAPVPATVAYKTAYLKFNKGEYAGAEMPIGAEGIKLGRDPEFANAVFKSEDIGRKHCTVQYDGSRMKFMVTDHGSQNKTYNLTKNQALPPNEAVELNVNDRIRLGLNSEIELILK